jgi:phosphoglycerate dehydrogenase-like enzyme
VPEILLSEVAFQRFGSRLPDDLEPIRMQQDGSLLRGRIDAAPVDREAVEPEIVWGTTDLFDDDGPLRPFFGLLLRAPSVRWFQSFAAGMDAPVFAEVVLKGIRLTTSHVTDVPIAEYVLGMVLDAYLGAERWRRNAESRSWSRHDFRELHGTTWLVIGLGSIGSAVAVRARAFGCRVIGCRRTPSGQEPVDEMVTPDRIADVLPDADIVVLSAPASAETRHLVDDDFLSRMRPESTLVNIARGSLVDEAALLRALDRGVPELAILDVTETEPLPPDNPLWDHPRVRLTPHNAAGGLGRYPRAADLFFENLGRYRCGEPLLHEVGIADLDR